MRTSSLGCALTRPVHILVRQLLCVQHRHGIHVHPRAHLRVQLRDFGSQLVPFFVLGGEARERLLLGHKPMAEGDRPKELMAIPGVCLLCFQDCLPGRRNDSAGNRADWGPAVRRHIGLKLGTWRELGGSLMLLRIPAGVRKGFRIQSAGFIELLSCY
jgi:hypothetical protein